MQAEVGNLTDAIAGGLLRTSPALAQRLATVESELARLQSQQTIKYPALLVPDLRKRFLEMVASLDDVLTRDPERGREELRDILGERIKMQPDESGSFS